MTVLRLVVIEYQLSTLPYAVFYEEKIKINIQSSTWGIRYSTRGNISISKYLALQIPILQNYDFTTTKLLMSRFYTIHI